MNWNTHSIFVARLPLTAFWIGLSVQTLSAASWVTTTPMTVAREFHTATLLTNGEVLVVGGGSGGGFVPLAGAELYEPATGAWLPTGSLTNARYFHTATLLQNGKVLVAGGAGTTPAYTSAEIYDPGTGRWTPTPRMHSLHAQHTATLLGNGKVLVAAGGGNNTAELYDPNTGTWTLTGSLAQSRNDHTATLLPDGKVLVAGGFGSSLAELASVELYDPATGVWTNVGSLSFGRANQTATLLLNGLVLATGGRTQLSGFVPNSELYSPAATLWQQTGSLGTARYAHTATLLLSGQLLVAGGWATNGWLSSAEIYEPASGLWTPTDSMNTPREYHAAVLLPNGKVFVTGGDTLPGGRPTATAELFDSNSPPIARCRNVVKEADANCQAEVAASEVDDGSTDPDGDPITLSLDPPGPYSVGITQVTLIVADNHGATDSCSATIEVRDTTPPIVTCSVLQTLLWPPNHKLVNVGLSAAAVDECSPGLIPLDIRVLSNGGGVNDATGIAPGTLQLRAEREGRLPGRVYLLVVTAADASGNLGVNCCTVVVPLAQSPAALAAASAEASSASSYCLSHQGEAPPGYFQIGEAQGAPRSP